MGFPSYKEWMERNCDGGEVYAQDRATAFAEEVKKVALDWALRKEIEDSLTLEAMLDDEGDVDFSFPDFAEWCEEEYAGELGAYEDMLYDAMRDEEIMKEMEK